MVEEINNKMVFVTVGTHEQQFNRLIEEVDRLKGEGLIEDEVIMQTGFSTYEPKYCIWSKLIPYSEMQKNIVDARIVITHGGPASFIAPLQLGKIPIVVPRNKECGEHVNNHQLEFCESVESRKKNIILVTDIKKLGYTIKHYDSIIERKKTSISNNNIEFNRNLNVIVKDLFEL